jgi:ribonucleoside-triphosphate reductase
MLTKIRKRNKQVVPFEAVAVKSSIIKAMISIDKVDDELADKITTKTVELLSSIIHRRIPSVEELQDVVEKVLMTEGLTEEAKAYILYRDEHARIRKAKEIYLDVTKTIEGYLGNVDWRTKENANADFSFSGLMLYTSGTVIANYVLDSLYSNEVSEAHKNGDLHIHDLSMGIAGYCAGWNLRNLLAEGFNGVARKTESSAPKHFDTALGQMVNFLGTLQNEWAGAQAFNSFDTYLAPYVRSDNLSCKEVKQGIQKFVFSLNIASRWGGQTPFTNITFDLNPPKDLENEFVTLNGVFQNKEAGIYGDYQKEMDLINRAFMEVMMEGDSKGRIFTFPIPTYNLTKNFKWDCDDAELLFKMTGKYGTPYFSNFIKSDLNPSDVRSMCCHLKLDLTELRQNVTGGLFGSGESTGSLGVVTINMPRIGYTSKSDVEFFEQLGKVMEIAMVSLETKRKIVNNNIEAGLFPYTKRYLGSLKNHFSTIGLVGMNEACLNLFGKDLTTKKGIEFTENVLDFMLKKLKEFQVETGNLYNLEATPAEGTSYRLARIDKKKYPEIKTAGTDKVPYYTNSTMLPVGYTDDMFDAFKMQEDIQAKYTGGTVIHCFVGEEIKDWQVCKQLVRKLAEGFKVPYFTITPTFSICPNHGYISGEKPKCPECGGVTEVYSRIVGYFRPIANWNEGKKEEFKDRVEYEIRGN